MRIEELHYDLPEELIAQHPLEPRDASRLMVVHRDDGSIEHAVFRDLPTFLPPRTLLVVNDTQVLPARLTLRRATSGRIEALFLQVLEDGSWEVMVTGAGRLRPGETLVFEGRTSQGLRMLDRREAGCWRARPEPPGEVQTLLSAHGRPPLPPYIHRDAGTPQTVLEEDRRRYQTVYARVPGAVAAPTAGLHFTPELIARLKAAGMEFVSVTLHVGAGTFAPVRVRDLAEHPMHAEWFDFPEAAAGAVALARRENRCLCAVGTTSVRVLESCAAEQDEPAARSGWTRLLIYPPYRFRWVRALITNFHLPGSTLLALVYAFAGRELIRKAYDEAVRRRYRFYSYGDAMLIL